MPKALLFLESLETRTAPANFGIPWQDPTHVTLSFAPDGTVIAGHTSNLFNLLAQFPSPAAWQREIIRAFQTWAVYANISVGLVSDSGDPFGVAGQVQGDARFGDIRIGAQRMSDQQLAITVPPDPYYSGTLAGDVFLNSSYTFNQSNLFPVMLHEAGHAFGLDHNTDPNSVMFGTFHGQSWLAPEDISAIQALYGARALDHNGPDNSFATATQMDYSGIVSGYTGTTPVVAYGDRATSGQVSYFWVQPIPAYNGPVTFRLQTSGISFLEPRLTVYDQNYQLLGQAQSTSAFGDTVSVQLPQSNPLANRYYVEVDSGAADLFGIGRYALSVTFDGRLLVDPNTLPATLRGPYDDLTNENDMAQLFSNPTNVFFNGDLHTNNTVQTAEVLTSTPGYAQDMRYHKVASISDLTDMNYYRIPASWGRPANDQVLVATLVQMPVNGVLPVVSVYDASTNPVATDILLNGNGTYTVQATNVTPAASYYLQVAPAHVGDMGNFSLTAFFGTAPVQLTTMTSNTLTSSQPQVSQELYVMESQLFQFVLTAGIPGMPQDETVRMDLYNSAGKLVFTLTGQAGNTVSGSSVFLVPGEYHAYFTAQSKSQSSLAPLFFLLRGLALSDPIGASSDDPTMQPQPYPSGSSSSSYYWQPS
jgi:hypothetical protein